MVSKKTRQASNKIGQKNRLTRQKDLLFEFFYMNPKVKLTVRDKIQLFTRPKITLLPKNLLNNVVNGIKLKGYFTIK